MTSPIVLKYKVDGDDFTSAGTASGETKKELKGLGLNPEAIRKVSICMYEGEINMVLHAHGGEATVEIFPEKITIILEDQGPGIEDISLVMQEGYSTAGDFARNLGFGAGMGLPNMKKYSDDLQIKTKKGEGTTVTMVIYT